MGEWEVTETTPIPAAVVQHATAVGKEWGEYEQNHLSPWGHLLQNKLK